MRKINTGGGVVEMARTSSNFEPTTITLQPEVKPDSLRVLSSLTIPL